MSDRLSVKTDVWTNKVKSVEVAPQANSLQLSKAYAYHLHNIDLLPHLVFPDNSFAGLLSTRTQACWIILEKIKLFYCLCEGGVA